MKLYIKSFSSYRDDIDNLDIKKELKHTYKQDTRRKDAFIHLAMLGILKLQEKININPLDELYMTSGVGNTDVLQRVDDYVYRLEQCIKPFDFINMLGNTTSYYVANTVGLKGKNIFQISDNFTFINSLISIFASISSSKKEAILGSIDLIHEPKEIHQRILGLQDEYNLISSTNYQYLSLDSKDSLASLEFDVKIYTIDEINLILQNNLINVIASPRCRNLQIEKENYFFETMPSYLINQYTQKNKDLLYIDCFEDEYKILKLNILK